MGVLSVLGSHNMPSKAAIVTKDERSRIANSVISEFRNSQPCFFMTMRLKGVFPWPGEFTKLRLLDRDWLLWPKTAWDRPGIVIISRTSDGNEEATLAMRFLSAFSWVHGCAIEDEGYWIVGSHPNSCLRDEADPDPFLKSNQFLIDEYDYLPFPIDDKAQLALALYREAACIQQPAYKFLSLYKILNIVLPDGRSGVAQIDWINSNISKITGHTACERLRDLRTNHSDIGNYLYTQGRCAVAHAYVDPIASPDRPQDRRRLFQDMPLIKALAELMIEEHFLVESRSTIWRKHRYELAGFKKRLGEELVEQIVNGYDFNDHGQLIGNLIIERLQPLSVRLRGNIDRPLENLVPKIKHYSEGKILLECVCKESGATASLGLNFNAERLDFDIEGSFSVPDRGDFVSAQRIATLYLFLRKLIANGVLEVWSNGEQLGRKDPYIPENIDMAHTLNNYEELISHYRKLHHDRLLGYSRRSMDEGNRHALDQSGRSPIPVFGS